VRQGARTMTARRFLLLGSFLTPILAACSSHNSFFFSDGGLDGSSEPAEQSSSSTPTTKKDAGKRDSASTPDDPPPEEDDASFVDAAKKDAKADVSTFDTNTCTISITSGDATCDSCIESSCCVEVNNCFDNSDCAALDSCIGNCLDLDAALQSACASDCNSSHASSASKWQAAASCIQNTCSGSCN
jgi:hypothetical protein